VKKKCCAKPPLALNTTAVPDVVHPLHGGFTVATKKKRAPAKKSAKKSSKKTKKASKKK
jgi:hypothetical protein